jgi:FGFR1 oncogene partner
MDELKNLVIQTLEVNGILGQIRAKLRSSVFKVIDNNDPQHNERAMHWENPLAQKVLETTESALAADLIREYLEFYRLDYTLSILIPEANMKQDPLDKDELIRKSKVDKPSQSEPLLVQILKERLSGGRPAQNLGERKEDPVFEKKSPQATDEQKASKFKSTAAVEKTEKSEKSKKDELSYLNKPVEKPKPSPKAKNKKNDDNDYMDDFEDDDIEEMLPVEDIEDHDRDENKLFSESGNAFTGSQSMGMDPSVNTLAMDEYDHVEEVIRIG